jgi:hypothetical protein
MITETLIVVFPVPMGFARSSTTTTCFPTPVHPQKAVQITNEELLKVDRHTVKRENEVVGFNACLGRWAVGIDFCNEYTRGGNRRGDVHTKPPPLWVRRWSQGCLGRYSRGRYARAREVLLRGATCRRGRRSRTGNFLLSGTMVDISGTCLARGVLDIWDISYEGDVYGSTQTSLPVEHFQEGSGHERTARQSEAAEHSAIPTGQQTRGYAELLRAFGPHASDISADTKTELGLHAKKL